MTPCVAVCVCERERGLRPQNKSIFVSDWNHIFHPPVSLSLSLSYSLSLPITISFRDTETVKKNTQIWTLILRVCPVPVSLLFEHPLRVHTHTHTHLTFYVSVWANFLSQSRHFLHVSSHHMRSSSTLRIPLRSGAALSPLSPTLGTS